MRLFTAIDLPAPMRQALADICYGLPRVRWLEPSQIHLTLVFIGEANPALLTEILDALGEVRFPPFRLQCQGIGSFRSGALWLGVDKAAELMDLESAIRRQLRAIDGLQIDTRKYSPHITLGRMDRRHPPRLDHFLALHQRSHYSCEVGEFLLKSSQLGPKGAQHRIERHFISTG